MRRFKYLLLLTLLGLMFTALPVMAADIQVVVDGKVVEFTDQQPYIDKANRTQVPLRAPMEAMGCEVSWNDSLQQAVISKDGTMVEFVIGSNKYTINNDTKIMDTTATITGNRTCIPIRYAAEAFGAEVDWVADKKAVAIYTEKVTADEKQELEKEIPEVLSKYTVSIEDIRIPDRVDRENVKVYRTDTLPIDTGDTTILALEYKVINKQRAKLLITVDRAETLKVLHVYFDKKHTTSTSTNNRTNYVYWDKKDKNGNYILELGLLAPTISMDELLKMYSVSEQNSLRETYGDDMFERDLEVYRIPITAYNEIGFETKWGEIYYIQNPFKK